MIDSSEPVDWLVVIRLGSVGQHVHEGDGEHAAAVGVALHGALHPVVVLGAVVEDDDDFALPERQLVLVVCLAVVQGAAPLYWTNLNKFKIFMTFYKSNF